jgi:hypothetical protein
LNIKQRDTASCLALCFAALHKRGAEKACQAEVY